MQTTTMPGMSYTYIYMIMFIPHPGVHSVCVQEPAAKPRSAPLKVGRRPVGFSLGEMLGLRTSGAGLGVAKRSGS